MEELIKKGVTGLDNMTAARSDVMNFWRGCWHHSNEKEKQARQANEGTGAPALDAAQMTIMSMAQHWASQQPGSAHLRDRQGQQDRPYYDDSTAGL